MQLEFRKIILIGLMAFITMTLFQRWTTFQEERQKQVSKVEYAQDGSIVDQEIPDTPSMIPDSNGVQEKSAQEEVLIADAQTSSAADGQHIIVKTDMIIAQINTNGGEIAKLDLIKHPVSVKTPDIPFQLLKSGGADVFTAQSGLIGKQEREYPNHKTLFIAQQIEYELADDADKLDVKLVYKSADGIIYTKIFTFTRNSYEIDLNFEILNNSTTPWEGYLYAQFQRSNVQTEKFGFFGGSPTYKGGAIYEPIEKYQKIDFGDIESNALNVTTDSGWVGMLQHYFVGAWIPTDHGPFQFYSKQINRQGQPLYNIGYKTVNPFSVAAGEQGQMKTRVYVGAKEKERLLAQNADGLELTVDYGWLTAIASPLFWVMNEIHKVVKNWGWAIVFVTILLKLLFFPLSAASYKSMAKMKKFQPRLLTLRERYSDDRQKLNAEMMKLYKQEKINPMGGCLPIVIQIPVFIALYWVLLESVELRQAPFIGWIQDLSLKDPFYVLPILYGISMFIMQRLNPAPVDPIQQKVMMALPIVFTFLFLWFPSGLVLYWLVNNILSMSQQWYITRKYA